MNFDLIAQWIAGLTFREAVWLFPFAFTLHVLDEVRQFTAWANRHASAQFTFQEYLTIHLAGIVAAFIAAAVIWFFPNKVVVFLFFTFIFTPAVFFNIFFHAGATAAFGAYCPGLLTFVLSPITVRGSAGQPLAVSSDADQIQLQLALPPGDWKSLEAGIQTLGGKRFWSQQQLKPRAGKVIVTVPAGKLSFNDYILTLSAINRAGKTEEINRYSF